MNKLRGITYGTMIILSLLFAWHLSQIPAHIKTQKLKVVLDLIEQSSPHATLQVIEKSRYHFYDLLFCRKLECLKPEYLFWSRQKSSITIPFQEGIVVVPNFYEGQFSRSVYLIMILILIIIFIWLQTIKRRKTVKLLNEHAKYKSFFHDMQVVIERLTSFQDIKKIKNELQRFGSEKKTVFYKTSSICGIAREVIDEFEGRMTLKTDHLVNDIVYFDGCFYRTFRNLFKNSIEAGATQIELDIMKENHSLVVSITDNGEGIPKEIQKRIRLHSASTKDNGLGVALFSLKRDLSYSGGQLEIKSQKGKTVFKMLLNSFSSSELIHLEDDETINELWNVQQQVYQFHCKHYRELNQYVYQSLKEANNKFQFLFIDRNLNGKLLDTKLLKKLESKRRKIFLTSGLDEIGFENLGKLITIA